MLKDLKNLKILIVEDDEIARENAVEFLEEFSTNIYEAPDAFEGLKIYEKTSPDIIITDIEMPKLNGLEFVKKIRESDKKVQIIVLTAFCDTKYLLKAVELGLIKYLIKPIDEKEFREALSLAANSIKEDESNIISLEKELIFDMFNLTLLDNGEIIKLRTKETQFLALLIKNRKRFVTYIEIENSVWEDEVMSKDALKTLVKNIKKKIPSHLITNLSGTGYKIEL